MRPDWDRLAEAWSSSRSVLIGDVDCTSQGGKSVCDRIGVHSYPTMRYFTEHTPRDGADYRGNRSFEALNSFVEIVVDKDWSNLEIAIVSGLAGICAAGVVLLLYVLSGCFAAGGRWSRVSVPEGKRE